MTDQTQDPRTMTADTIGKDILSAIDPDAPGLPAPGDTTPTEEELDRAYDEGYQAAAEGRPESDCPVMRGELCIQWVKGWKDFMTGVEKAA